MTRYALDTTTFSLLMRRHPAAVATLRTLAPDDRVAICAVVRGEIAYGLARLPSGRRKTALAARAHDLFLVIPCDEVSAAVADVYGELKRAAERKGMPLGENDLWIAAQARASESTLVTSDRDFGRLPDLTTEDWSS
jgi:tRNA(fMet)-specific endonuclease VapC